MKAEMYNTLDKFFAEKTISDVNRDTFLICNLNDKSNKITISLVFMRDWDSLETDQYNSVIIQDKGAVLTFPCYWISVPKELAIPYFEYVIDDLYNSEISKWNIPDNNTGNETGNNGNGNCNCPCGVV